MRSSCAIAALLLAAATPPGAATAQATKPPKSKVTKPQTTVTKPPQTKSMRQLAVECGISETAPWAVKQREWFGEPGHPWTDDTLRTQLVAAAGLPGLLVPPVQLGVEFSSQLFAVESTSNAMAKRLMALGGDRNAKWPTKTLVGAAGVHAVFLIAHHDTALARVALKHMMEAGPTESPAPDVATLEDRLRLATGRKQIYGTQFARDANGVAFLLPMEDSVHADLRREGAALPPFKSSLCMAKNQR